jgi:NAD(P)H-quinone oxidoreductase subunit 5
VAAPAGGFPAAPQGWIESTAIAAGPLLFRESPVFGTFVAGSWLLAICAVLLFCGAIAKSAQVPLHVWLPDAMEGPTPVSALIHAATMVAAGVYLVARMYPVFDHGGLMALGPLLFRPLDLVAFIGTVTALLGALIALTQPDIKRILAYSTISQLGFMMAALGAGGVIATATESGMSLQPALLPLGLTAGVFHLVTHAFFKGLLFLAAGSVIHATGTQDVWEMGGLRRYLPWTFATSLVGYLALTGVPFVAAGFYSKDLILEAAHQYHPMMFWALVIAAGLTAFYMTRMMVLVFGGQWAGRAETLPREPVVPAADPDAGLHSEDVFGVGHEQEEQPHPGAGHGMGAAAGPPRESPGVMVGPLVLLAVPALLLGYLAFPGQVAIYDFLHYQRPDLPAPFQPHLDPLVTGTGAGAVLLGIVLGWLAYRGRRFNWFRGTQPSRPARLLYTLSYRKFFFDEVYWRLLVVPALALARSLRMLDLRLIDGLVVGIGRLFRAGGQGARYLQTGQVSNYLLTVFAGIVILMWALANLHLFP